MSGLSLNEHDITELRHLLAHARDESGLALPWPFLRRLKDLIGCDALAFNGMDSTAETHFLTQSIDDDEYEDGSADQRYPEDEPFWRHYWSSDPCCYPDVSGDYTTVTSLSDFYSARQWHATGMYVDYLGPPGLEHELMMCLPDGPGRSLRVLCFRGPGADFGARERFLLTLLRPHVAEAYRAAVRRRSVPATLTPRQLEILDMVKVGFTNYQIARRTNLSEGTVRTHVSNIFTRLDVTSRTAAANRLAEATPT